MDHVTCGATRLTCKHNMMDAVRPPTVWVAGRCYRVFNPVTTSSTTNYAEADTYGYGELLWEFW